MTNRPNPFAFGRALGPAELVDRVAEVEDVARALLGAETLFVIGPRRHGKTSIINAAEHKAETQGAVVLRFDAEAFPHAGQLAERIVAEAASALAGPAEKAAAWASEMFSRLRPNLTFSPQDQTWSVSFGVGAARDDSIPHLVDALNGIERAAAASGRDTAVVIDEIQELLEPGGVPAEKQVRAAIQTHEHVGYVFAGSKTRYMNRLVSDPAAPFFNQGGRLYVGAIPDDDFLRFLRRSFEASDFEVADGAPEAILECAERVPYNVQMLASECWNRLRARPSRVLDARAVRTAADELAAKQDGVYSHIWSSLSAGQKTALTAYIREEGELLLSSGIAERYRTSPSTMQKSLAALEKKQILRTQEARGEVSLRLQDPFFGIWVDEIAPPTP